MDRRFRGTWIVLALALAVAGSAAGFRADLRSRILPDLFTNLARAERGLEEGRLQTAMAHTDSVLLPMLKVHVAFDGVEQNRRAECLKVIKASFSAWQKGMGSDTSFKTVDVPSDADIRITFIPHVFLDGNPVGGLTHWQRSIRTYSSGDCVPVLSATMEIAAEQPNGRPMSFNHMLQVAAHEIGHVLGMQDSSRRGDVMGPLDLSAPVTTPKSTELDALAEIREEARRLRLKAQALAE